MEAKAKPYVAVIEYEPRPLQLEVHRKMRKHRYGVLVCHRQFGKTVALINQLIRDNISNKKYPDPRYAYIAPTYRQGKAIAWDYIQKYSRAIPDIKVNQAELRVDYPNGGQVRIYGADNPDSLRGLHFDGVGLDEYPLHPPRTWTEVVQPTLVSRQGWALFSGTPNGRDEFYKIATHARERQEIGDPAWFFAEYKASQTGVIKQEELDFARTQMTNDEYMQEYECSFEASVKGAIYTAEMATARAEKRITVVPYDPALPVDTDWDLGVGDATAIWFSQSLKSGEVRLIDFAEGTGEGFPYYAKILKSKPYSYGRHWAPHDIQVRELSSGRSRLEVAQQYGINFSLTPRITKSILGEVEEGIHAVRMLFPRCWFDATKCAAGIESLMHYRRDYNLRLREFKATPVHDWASHGADAFRGLAVRHKIPRDAARIQSMEMSDSWTWC